VASKFKYHSTAAVLGIGWFLVLLIPEGTRGWLLKFIQGLAPYHLSVLVLSSVIVAFIFRRAIVAANIILKHLTCGCVIPYVGCIVYLTIITVFLYERKLSVRDVHDALGIYLFGIIFALRSFFVVLPFGIVSQYIMNKVAASANPAEKPASV
jgi:hypothetical protein